MKPPLPAARLLDQLRRPAEALERLERAQAINPEQSRPYAAQLERLRQQLQSGE